MTNLEKWKEKLAEAKDGEDFMYTLELMDNEIYEKQCYPACEFDNCEKCKAGWLDKEVERPIDLLLL